MHPNFLLITAIGIFCSLGFSNQENDRVDFPGIGQVSVRTSRPENDFPTIAFVGSGGRVLLEGKVGTADPTIFRINPLENEGGRENPIMGYKVVQLRGHSPVVLAVAMYGGGSDCEYEGAAFGEHGGKLQPLFTKQVFTHVEGGMFLGDLGLGRGEGFAIWNFIWGSEGHADPHRYNLDLYHLDPSVGKFKRFARMATKRSYGTDVEALAEFGINYPNLLQTFPDFGC